MLPLGLATPSSHNTVGHGTAIWHGPYIDIHAHDEECIRILKVRNSAHPHSRVRPQGTFRKITGSLKELMTQNMNDKTMTIYNTLRNHNLEE